MGNIVEIKGEPFDKPWYVKDMLIGDVGFCTEWAVDWVTNTVEAHLDPKTIISRYKEGTESVKVKCVGEGKYTIEYTPPLSIYTLIGHS